MKKTSKQICRKIVAEILAVTLFLTGIPFSSFAAETPETLPEVSIDSSELEEGAFYLTSVTAELEENRGSSVLLKICRNGAAETEEAVKLVMLDMTARYGEDYKIRLYDRGLFEAGVIDPEDGQSVKEAIGDANGEGEEYNYSDAIIDGSITAESQLTEEEDLEKQKQALKEKVEEIVSKEEEKAVSGSPLLASVKASGSEAVRKNLTLAQAKELMTGIVNDKESMTYSEEGSNLMSSILGTDDELDPWLSEGKENLAEALSSSYLILHFSEGETYRCIEIIPIDNDRSDGDRMAGFSLESVDGSKICKSHADLTLTITDDEEYVPDTVQFSHEQYVPENGYVTVTIERDGALNGVSSVMLDSEQLTAVPGVNYSEVHAEVYFVYGQKKRTVKIPVTTEGLTEDAEFCLKIQEPASCVIGECDRAICTIRLTDESFSLEETDAGNTETAEADEKAEAADAAGTEGTQELKEEVLLGGGYEEIAIDTARTFDSNLQNYALVYDKTANMLGYGKVSTSGNSRGWNTGGTVVLKPQGTYQRSGRSSVTGVPGWADAEFRDDTSNSGTVHYDWNGFGVLCANRSFKRDATVKMSLIDGANKYHQKVNTTNEWSMSAQHVVADCVEVKGVNVSTETKNYSKDSAELTINAVYPIMRLFDIELVSPDAMLLINEKGKRIDSRLIGDRDLVFMNKTGIQAAGGDGVRTVVSGSEITVILPEVTGSELVGLELVDQKTKQTKKINAKKGADGKSLSFTLNNDFLTSCISSSASYVTFEKNTYGVGGMKGRLQIKPVVKPKTMTVKVKKEEHISISLWDGEGAEKQGRDTDGDGYVEYEYSYGDWVRYSVKLDDEYQKLYTFRGIHISDQLPDENKTKYGSDYTLEKASAGNYAQEPVLKPVIYAWTYLAKKENVLQVRVPKDQLDEFQQDRGIFLEKNHIRREEQGDYWVYIIDDDAEQIPGKYYELLAVPKDEKNVAVWQAGYNTNKYSQPRFYYQGDMDAGKNTLTLSAWPADKLRYVIKGKMQYEDAALGEGVSQMSSWMPASQISIAAGSGYGISQADGTYKTGVFTGVKDCFIRMKLNVLGNEIYRDIKLNTENTEILSAKEGGTKEDQEVQVITYSDSRFSAINLDRPHASETLVSGIRTDNLKQIRIRSATKASMVKLTAAIDNTNSKGQPCNYTLITDDEQISLKEEVSEVHFVIVDPVTKAEKAEYVAKQSTEDETIYSYSFVPSAGNYGSYQSGDKVYVRIITNRETFISEKESGTKGGRRISTMEYPLVNTGITFMEEQPTPPDPITLDMMTLANRNITLPIIDSLDMYVGVKYFSVGLHRTINGGMRISIGAMLGDHYGDFANKSVTREELADDGGSYGLTNFTDGFKAFKSFSKRLNTDENGKETSSTKWQFGKLPWSIKPIFGAYFDFSKVYDVKEGPDSYSWHFDGGGGYGGVLASVRATAYFTISGVPVYLGGSLSATAVGELGVRKDKKRNLLPGESPNQQIKKITEDTSTFAATVRASATIDLYAGVGICGTVGARGGFSLAFYLLWDPRIQEVYPDIHTFGFQSTGTFKIWLDLVLLSVPIPIVEVLNSKKGYWADLEKIRNNQLGSAQADVGEPLGSALSVGAAVKKRQGNAEFTANEEQETELLGASYSHFTEKTILNNSYDLIEERVVAYEVNGKEKLLMIYLADDPERPDDERSVLMYTVYDKETDTWTEPAPVDSSDSHADVMPQLTVLTGEQEILITWVSRNRDISEKTSYDQYYAASQIYTARFNMKTEEGEDPIHDVRCMTDDVYLNANPKAVYDSETGDVLLYFLKAEVPAKMETAEELLAASLPQLNKAEPVYLLYDGKTKCWVTDQYFAGELADASMEEVLLEVMGGQRFVPSAIKGHTIDGKVIDINNPAVSEYDVSVVEADEEGKANLGVYAFLVDADNSLDTNQDREIFLETYDFEQHTFSEPIRVTNNSLAESDLQLVKNNEETWLFWRESYDEGLEGESGTRLNYVELSGLLSGEDISEEIETAEIESAEEELSGLTFGGYRAFADSEGNLLVAWQETVFEEETEVSADMEDDTEVSADTEGDLKDEDIFSTVIYLAGYYPEEDICSSWSDGIRLEYTDMGGKVYDSLQFATFKDGRLYMFSNQYRLVSDENGYETPDSRLVQTVYAPAPSFRAKSLEVEEPENPGEDYLIWVELENTGIRTAKEVSYSAELLLDGEVLDTSGDMRLEEEVPAGDSTFGAVLVNPGRELGIEEQRRLTLEVRAREDDAALAESVLLPLYKELPEYEFEELELIQEDEENFVLCGILEGLDQVEAQETDQLKISDGEGNVLVKTSFTEAGLSADDGCSVFYFELPASKLNFSGSGASVCIEAERDGESCSAEYPVCGYLTTPMCLKINGSSSETMNIRPGQSIELVGSYTGSDVYLNGDIRYWVEDGTAAEVHENVLTGKETGSVQLCMEVEPYGGYKEITVNVGYDAEEESSSTGAVTEKSGPSTAQALSGSWKQEADGGWYFVKTDGTKATGWGYTGNGELKEYFHFNEKGVMDSGWYLDTDGTWYYLHETHDGRFGAMDRGWHRDASDNNWYYLDLSTGKMKTGWLKLGGNWYCLSTGAAEATWVQDKKGRWIYKGGKGKPYGAMYANETTPDGYTVGVDGAWKP